MSIKLVVNKSEVEVNITRFPAGESLVAIKDDCIDNIFYNGTLNAMIYFEFESNSDLIDLLMLTDCIRRKYDNKVDIALSMDYVPYARQDRVCNKGESLSIAVIAALINSQNYTKVFIKDAHSEVTPALINNCVNISLDVVARKLAEIMEPLNIILVSPDAGANKKVYSFAKAHGFTQVVRADKTRDVATGKITGTKVYHDWFMKIDKDFLILDDICDGGYTFIQLAKELRKLTTGKIYLYVTHGIFTKGIEVFEGLIDKIYVSNLMYKGDTKDFVEII